MKRTGLQKFECESCGAALSSTIRRGQYRCEFCGAVYINEEQYDGSMEVFPTIPQPPAALYEKGPTSVTTEAPYTPTRKAKPKIGVIALVPLGMMCLLLFFILDRCGQSCIQSGALKLAQPKQPTPVMLAALPDNPVPAGQSVAYGGWEITVSRSVSRSQGKISLSIDVANWTGANTIFRYKPADIELWDDAGNQYNLSRGSCASDLLYLTREMVFTAGDTIKMESNSNWCQRESALPYFSGTIAPHVTRLYLVIRNFGPFDYVVYEFKL